MMNHRTGCLAIAAVAGMAASMYVPPAQADVGAVLVAPGAIDPMRLYLRTGEVDTSQPRPDLQKQIGAHPAGTRFVIQLDGPMTPERRQRMQAAGIELGDYLPMHAYIATLDKARPEAVAGLEFVRWHEVYQNDWKIDPDAGTRSYQTAERQELVAAGRDYLHVLIFPGADVGAVEQAIWAIPEAAILWSSNTGARDLGGIATQLSIEINLADVAQLAQIPGVQYVEPASDITTRSARRNERARWIVQSNQTGVYPLYAQGLRGEGQIVGLLDTAVRQDHCSFNDPMNPIGPNHRKIVAYNTAPGAASHGTHTAGTVVGDAGQEDDTRGVAYRGRLAYNYWGSSPFGDITQRLMTHHNQGARTHSNSWGDDGTTAYNVLTRGIDLYQWENESGLTLWAVTNLSALKNPENAKNLLAVGASRSAGLQHEHCTGGTGPTSDGRRKPEIYAPGCGTVSASTSACGTTASTGTSMACPAVAGTAMLVRQYYMDGFYPVGVQVPGSEFEPSSALVKATLLNSAVDMTGVTGYPSNQEGWGRVLADNAVYFDGDPRKLRISDVWNAEGLSTNQVTEYFVPVIGSGEPFRVTLVWTEPPATAGAAFASINDLDLEVVDPTGQQMYRGNVFNTSTGFSITGGNKDDRNNVEQVHINSPATGLWTVRVRGAAVNQGMQGYALVKTGDITPAEPPELIMIMADPVPHLITPNEPYELRVRILEGSQTLVPGSARLHYRAGSTGAFSEATLTHVTGDLYAADLPGQTCGDSPEFYFSAQGDLGATVVFPPEAPTNILSTNVGVILTEPLLETTFAAAWPTGWSATGMWHVTSSCAPAGNTCAQGPYAYYGRSTTCNYNLPTGTHQGTLSSPAISLPAVPPDGGIVVKFCYALQTEGHPNFDKAELLVDGQTRPEWRLEDVAPTAGEPDRYWSQAEIDLTEFAGQTITLGWRFNTVNSLNNQFRGMHINDVRVLARVAGCDQTCYANCDGSTAEPILNVDDFTCFINAFAAAQALPHAQQIEDYANCDGSTNVPVLNVDDFTCFINAFAAGCP